MPTELCDLQIHVNGQQTFYIDEKIISRFSGKLAKMIKQEKRRTQIRKTGIEIDEFPGGADGFELAARFCYNGGSINITVSNVSLLHCSAVFLGMTEKVSQGCKNNLLHQTERFLQGMFYWTWSDVLCCLKSCEPFFSYADSDTGSGLVQKLMCSLLAKIAQNSDVFSTISSSSHSLLNVPSAAAAAAGTSCWATNSFSSSSSSSSSPENAAVAIDSCRTVKTMATRSESEPEPEISFFKSSSCSSSPSSLSSAVLGGAGEGGGQPSCWWFEDLTHLSPKVIDKFIKILGAYESENKSLVLTKFLLLYLKSVKSMCKKAKAANSCHDVLSTDLEECGRLADTAVHGVIHYLDHHRDLTATLTRKEMKSGGSWFSCRGLFSVLRLVSGFGLSSDCTAGLERLIGGLLDEAHLDDLLVYCGTNNSTRYGTGITRRKSYGVGGIYDVNLALRLVKVFVHDYQPSHKRVSVQRMKKVGRLMDNYLVEIAPDQGLSISTFLRVAESLPDFARDCFDGVYKAIDIYLESHPRLSFEERSRLCRCLNFHKLSLEACKDLAKNQRIPPRIAVQALSCQHPNIHSTTQVFLEDYHHLHFDQYNGSPASITSSIVATSNSNMDSKASKLQMVLYSGIDHVNNDTGDNSNNNLGEGEQGEGENKGMRLDLQRKQWRVMELERACREMKGHMSRMVKGNGVGGTRIIPTPPSHNRPLPRFC